MAQVKFWRGDYTKFSSMPKDYSTVYFVSNITVGMVSPINGGEPQPYSGIYIGDNLIASSQMADIDLTPIESIIGDLNNLEGDLVGKNIVECLTILQKSISDNSDIVALIETAILALQGDISSINNILGDGNFTSDILNGKNVTEAINTIGDLVGNTVEGSIGNLGDIHEDIQGDNIVTVVNNLDNKVIDLASFKSIGTDDSYQMPSTYTRLTYAQVKDKSAEEILDMMLFPDTLPTVQSQASVTLTISGLTTYKEIGETFNSTLTANYNRGVIGVSGISSTNKNYRGVADTYTFTGPSVNTTPQSTNTQALSNYKIAPNANTWSVMVSYGDGEMPISAKGTQQPQLQGKAGTVNSSNVTVNGVYPIITNKTNITLLNTKEALVSNSTKVFDITYTQANNETNKFKIAIASNSGRGNLSKVSLFNDLSGKFEEQSLSLFAKQSDENIDIQGNSVTYSVWSCTASAVGGGARYQFTFA